MTAGRTGPETALVTGASRGIGLELTKLFASDGADVLLAARSEGKMESIAEDLRERHGVEAAVFPADLAEQGAARDLYDRVTDAGYEVDALVNNAGFGVSGRFLETDLDQELDVAHLQVQTVTVLTKLLARDMADRGGGWVLNNASMAGFAPVPTSAVYAASKHYVRSLSEALAEDFVDEGITVTALCPGATDTAFMENGDFDESATGDGDLMDPETVARAGYEGLLDGERIVVPGRLNRFRVFLRRLMPRKAYVRAANRMQND
ncbi:short-chain dehydrogenase [Halobacteriales archaeon QS_1_68_20]|nr:MAG: short-chain dehydrogenase [Halobacteriales archaeon QS_1_68_20]